MLGPGSEAVATMGHDLMSLEVCGETVREAYPVGRVVARRYGAPRDVTGPRRA